MALHSNIAFHEITQVELTAIEFYAAEEGRAAFTSRALVMTGKDGERLRVTLFSDTVDGLRTPEERKRESHDPKPDSGDDPRYVGPEYDKYEAREHEPDYDHVGEQERYEQAWRDRP